MTVLSAGPVLAADPTFDTGHSTTISVAENTASGTSIGSAYTATDSDSGDTLTYTLSGTDMSSFSIVSTSGQLQTSAALDYETTTSYSVTVGVRDSKNADGDPDTADDDTIDVTINVTNVNEAPTIDSGPTTASSPENTATTAAIATYAATDPDASATLTWSLSGDDVGDFTITKNSSGHGELKFSSSPNHESPADNGTNNVYNVTVGVRDSKDANGNSDSAVDATRAVAITVTNVDEAGTVTLPSSFHGGNGGHGDGERPGRERHERIVAVGAGDSATGSFTNISGGTSASYTTVAADVTKYLRATASYTDPQGPGKTANLVTGQIGGQQRRAGIQRRDGHAHRAGEQRNGDDRRLGGDGLGQRQRRHADLLADRHELLVIHHQHGHRPDPDHVRGHVQLRGHEELQRDRERARQQGRRRQREHHDR